MVVIWISFYVEIEVEIPLYTIFYNIAFWVRYFGWIIYAIIEWTIKIIFFDILSIVIVMFGLDFWLSWCFIRNCFLGIRVWVRVAAGHRGVKFRFWFSFLGHEWNIVRVVVLFNLLWVEIREVRFGLFVVVLALVIRVVVLEFMFNNQFLKVYFINDFDWVSGWYLPGWQVVGKVRV